MWGVLALNTVGTTVSTPGGHKDFLMVAVTIEPWFPRFGPGPPPCRGDWFRCYYGYTSRLLWIRTTSKTSPTSIVVLAHMTLTDRYARGIEDKAAGQCRSDLGVCVDGLLTTLLDDLAATNATARTYRRPPVCSPPVLTSEELRPHHMVPIQRRGRQRRASRPDNPTDLSSPPPPLPSGTVVCYWAPSVREEVQVAAVPHSCESGRRQGLCGFRAGSLGAARAECWSLFLEYLRTFCRFPI